ncbi:MAG TPA: prepilin-type N-terminal cleavage/methylation domain-containing protein [Verrucomicrobiota bacterium]|nr:prepilin-type N-terminal cleavage/methylation domain-containing protein [Verrucomicrobiota bacterium]
MKAHHRDSKNGLTLIEVLIVIAVIAVLAAVVLANSSKRTRYHQRVACLSNLKNVGLSFRQWSVGGPPGYPMSFSTNNGGTLEYVAAGEPFRHLQVMSNELYAVKLLVCPADARKPARDFTALNNSNVSYFVGVDAQEEYPAMFLTGDRNLTNEVPLPANGIMELTSLSKIGWTAEMHDGKGNVGLSDGSVQSLNVERLREANSNSGVWTNRLAMPVE